MHEPQGGKPCARALVHAGCQIVAQGLEPGHGEMELEPAHREGEEKEERRRVPQPDRDGTARRASARGTAPPTPQPLQAMGTGKENERARSEKEEPVQGTGPGRGHDIGMAQQQGLGEARIGGRGIDAAQEAVQRRAIPAVAGDAVPGRAGCCRQGMGDGALGCEVVAVDAAAAREMPLRLGDVRMQGYEARLRGIAFGTPRIAAVAASAGRVVGNKA